LVLPLFLGDDLSIKGQNTIRVNNESKALIIADLRKSIMRPLFLPRIYAQVWQEIKRVQERKWSGLLHVDWGTEISTINEGVAFLRWKC